MRKADPGGTQDDVGGVLAAVLEQLPVAVIVADPSGRVRLANAQTAVVWGEAPPDASVVGDPSRWKGFHPDGRPYAPRDWPLAVCLATGEPVAGRTIEIERADGTRAAIEINAAPVRSEGGELVAGVSVFWDVSERLRREAEREAFARFQELLLAVVGHDLRNPLSAIAMTAEYVARGALSETHRRAIRRVTASAARMGRMIDQLLDVTRVRLGGALPIDPEPLDAVAIAAGIADEANGGAGAPLVVVTSRGDCSGEWDRDRLEQVLSNLVGNAASHGLPGRPITVSVDGSGAEVVIEVHNEGTPIAAEDLPRLFEAMHRGLAAPRGRSSGLGLGLFIARSIVEAHGGRIDVRSRAEDGTTFRVHLPRRVPPPPTPPSRRRDPE